MFSSAFDDSAVDFLEQMNVPAHKVASFELVDIGLIEKMARTGKPLIMSTGMASEDEISEAVEAARGAGATQIALLKCASAYPAPPEEANLLTIPELARRFDCPVGLSDHTMGIAVPVVAVALGACIIEKHLCLRRADGGPDGAFSLEPEEFKAMAEAVRTAEKALGAVQFTSGPREANSRKFRRSYQLGITHRRTAYNHPEGNSYIERFHRSLKEEEVWLNEYQNFDQAELSIARWIEEYNHDRPHRGLHGQTPHDARARFAQTLTSNTAPSV